MIPPLVHLTPFDPAYPTRLLRLTRPPRCLTTRGGPLEAACTVAIVGSRLAADEASRFARELAATLVGAGAVVVSGGALGIDAAAHQGALAAGGRTWAVCGTGCEDCFPEEHAALFEAIAQGPGAMIWPFAPAVRVRRGSFLLRNRVLVALADAVVVAQAGLSSGALRAAECARALRKPLWVVPAPPWATGFEGSRQLLAQGVRPLVDAGDFSKTLGLTPSPPQEPAARLSDAERKVLACLTHSPVYAGDVAERSHIAIQTVTAALLTLALEAVVVEGPPGFFRRRT